MPTWLLASLFAVVRAIYSAAIEAYVTWGLVNNILSYFPGTVRIGYLTCYLVWYIIGFIVAYFQFKRIIEY